LTAEATLVGGRYALEHVLGRGGMAIVYYATDTILERPVALKLLADHLVDDPGLRRRLLREARLAGRLCHPCIVQVFDAGEEHERPYIVMEYVDGETLATRLQRGGPLQPGEVIDLAVQVCDGLEHAHSAGLVHRDLKPQNLLATPLGRVKIADFGIARADETTRLTQAGTVLGSAGYLAPEQAAGAEVTAAADLYSLGAVLYELLSGEKPYHFTSLPELLSRQRIGTIRPLHELAPNVPTTLEQTVLRCLATDPGARPASAAQLARELTPAGTDAATHRLPGTSPMRATEHTTIHLDPGTQKTTPRQPGSRIHQIASAISSHTTRARIAAALVAAALLALILALTLPNDPAAQPDTEITPIPRSNDPAQQAQNLADWLRAQAR
jgi:eukaryotic-like serine/threonine-protein kinase